MPKFLSTRYESLQEVHAAYEAERTKWRVRHERIAKVRSLTNGLAVADLDGSDSPLTNYLTQYHRIAERVSRLTSAVTGTDTYATLTATTGDKERDTYIGSVLTTAFNQEVLQGSSFLSFIRLLAGEIQVCGGVAMEFTAAHEWLPEITQKIVIPYDTILQRGHIPYAFEPRVLSLEDLRRLRNSGKTEAIDDTFLKQLTKEAEDMVKGVMSSSAGEEHRDPAPLRDVKQGDCPKPETGPAPEGIPVWYYYETKDDKSVSCTIYSAQVKDGARSRDAEGGYSLLAHFPKYYDSVEQWLRIISIDSEIGGTGKFGETRGMAEIIYPSSMMIEFLLNKMLAGDIDQTEERFQYDSSIPVDPDAVAQWHTSGSKLLPRGITPAQRQNVTRHLSTPIGALTGNAAQLTSTGNTGGEELRVQSLERQEGNTRNARDYTSQFNIQADALITEVVRRCITGTPKGPGKEDIDRFRARVEDAGIDLGSLKKVQGGRLRYVQVSTARPTMEDKAVEWMTANIGLIPPQRRNEALRMVVSRVTGDPILARNLYEGVEQVINNQRTIASNEADEWARLAAVGEVNEIRASDVHEDHIPVHLKDLSGMLIRDQIRPWDLLDAAAFSGGVAHTFKHVEVLLSSPVTKDIGARFRNDLVQIQTAGQKIITKAQAAQQTAETQMSAKEAADIELKKAALELEAQKVGAGIQKENNLEDARERRAQSQDRKADNQLAVNAASIAVNAQLAARKLDLEQKKLESAAPPLTPPSAATVPPAAPDPQIAQNPQAPPPADELII